MSLSSLFSHLKKEAVALCLNLPSDNLHVESFSEDITTKVLPQNINDEGTDNINENILRVAKDFINVCDTSENIMCDKKMSRNGLAKTLVPEKANEETLRRFEAQIHNTQSIYDTYIKKLPSEADDKMLSSFRGHISIALHLLGTAKELSHFYERHGTTLVNKSNEKNISKIIKHKEILDIIFNFALYYYTFFIRDGQIIANNILDKFTVAKKAVVKVPEGLGFHLRPSTLVAKIANHYGSQLTLKVNEKEFDASSVIDIMWAGGIIKKESITKIKFIGEKNAVDDLVLLSEANYGEDEIGNSTPLPDKLSYLRQDG